MVDTNKHTCKGIQSDNVLLALAAYAAQTLWRARWWRRRPCEESTRDHRESPTVVDSITKKGRPIESNPIRHPVIESTTVGDSPRQGFNTAEVSLQFVDLLPSNLNCICRRCQRPINGVT